MDMLAGRADRRLTDALCAIQIACAITLCGAQFLRMRESIEGVALTWIAFWGAFLLVNLGLAIEAARTFPSRLARQTIAVYAVWSVGCFANLALLLATPGVVWSAIDSVTAWVTGAGVVSATMWGRARGVGWRDPMVQAGWAVACKGVPQLTLAWYILLEGGAGISLVALTAGHLTIGMRLAQIALSIREAGWDRQRTALAIGELANQVSWLVATVAWWIAR
jgi:hypothetical protein